MNAPGRCGFAAAALAALLAFPACGNYKTPTEPPTQPPPTRPALGLSILPSWGGDLPGTLTLEGHFCPCAKGPVSVRVDNVDVGTLGCGETRTFPAAIIPARLQLSSPEISPFDGVVAPLDVGGPPAEYVTVRAGIWCASPPG